MDASGGLSKEEFLILQEQLIDLRNRNYELQESLQKKNQEIATLMSPKSEALQFATKLMNRRDKEKELTQMYETQLDALRMKLTTQEEEFRLQQETLLSELNKVVCQNEGMRRELQHYKATGSFHLSPQAGPSSAVHPLISEISRIENVSSHPVSYDDQTFKAEEEASVVEKLEQVKLSLAEKEALVSALESKLLEYKGKVEELDLAVEGSSLESGRLSSIIQEQQEEIDSLKEKLTLVNQRIEEKDSFTLYVLKNISSISERMKCENVSDCRSLLQRDLLDKEICSIMERISLNEEEMRRVNNEKNALQEMASIQTCLDETKARLAQVEEMREKEKLKMNDETESLLRKLHSLQENHENEVQMLRDETSVLCHELERKITTLEEAGKRELEERLLLEARYKLELEDRLKCFESEREEMRQKLLSLESSLSAKEEEKALSLKKQAAIIKELQRAIKEEKKRADSMERIGRSSYDEKEWHLVDELDAKSAQTLDGACSRSVSSTSALESDNVELINRLTSLQKTHADALDRINALESENARLCREIEDKSEIIEHWIRKKPLKFGTGFESPRRPEGVLRKFLSTTLTVDDTSNDIKEMNKKLQRMLEETLSKNIILQRDLQTLLERTEL
ncbi:hypothetical protein KIN20_023915 [Parelaphostrongylus tenuis]|uniref:GRIP1-associated protein 1 n=1 Tax=Parelaphostrongylus tenuis TaxID=148309 RepID=A0AAD5NAI3_PARTN|nr:hypothetical protein KIN20_023915 [Parelaphostrongylus tenuis]